MSKYSVPGRVIAGMAAFFLISLTAAACAPLGQPPVAEQSQRAPMKPSHQKKSVGQNRTAATRATPSQKAAPTAQRPRSAASRTPATSMQVRKGDTLYSVAWRYGKDVRYLARLNGLVAPYTIFPGQTILLSGQLPANSPRLAGSSSNPPSVAAPPSSAKPKQSTPNPQYDGRWVWPTSRRVQADYTTARKGVDFALQNGDQIQAAGAGQVVYAGSGLGGYANLVILKHSDALLSAYSFNGTTRVNEQKWVKAGQRLADIVDSRRDGETLHFELRRNGTPVNPQSVLPKRSS